MILSSLLAESSIIKQAPVPVSSCTRVLGAVSGGVSVKLSANLQLKIFPAPAAKHVAGEGRILLYRCQGMIID
jgi:hypothetical protein